MKHTELRKIFFEFFEKEGHRVYPSISLVPDDSSILFTTAGMVQFKDMFLGFIKMSPPRAVSIQKCVRTSDIDRVGETLRHLTFFEMLGNFSAGGYFKKEAIDFAWRFFTEVLNLDVSRLYATVHRQDKEAFELWKKILPEEKIVKLGDEDNFWTMGETGPCGYCSEIIYDLGEEVGCGREDCFVGCDCDRWCEVWNLVFTEFDRQKNGVHRPLKQKNIDTGMGFERLLAVVNGLKSPYETEVLKPIVDEIVSASAKQEMKHIRRLADHIRAAVFIIGDGVIPSNTGRGYVLRRLIRRAMVSAKKIGLKISLSELAGSVFDIFGEVYPNLKENAAKILMILSGETDRFGKTLEEGMSILGNFIKSGKKGKIPAEVSFELYSTYGFPIELLKDIAEENSLSVDMDGFNKIIKEEKKKSRATWAGSGTKDRGDLRAIASLTGPTTFRGYDILSLKSEVLAIVKKSPDEAEIVLKETPFYATSGGQIHDTGIIENESFRARVQDVFKTGDVIFHKISAIKGEIKEGDKILGRVDEARRRSIERHHTATHILQMALRKVIGDEVRQAGSFVTDEYFRFDFTVSRRIADEEIEEVENIANSVILSDLPVYKKNYGIEDAKKFAALHFFDEKYGDVVRVVTIGGEDPNGALSAEFCGGCHVRRTGEIGLLKITAQKAISQGVRRIEAVAGFAFLKYLEEREAILGNLSEKLKTDIFNIEKRVEKLIQEGKEKKESVKIEKEKILEKAGKIKGVPFVIFRGNFPPGQIPFAADKIAEFFDGVIFVYALSGKKVSYVCKVAKKFVEDGFSAGKFLKEVATLTSTKAGGAQKFARGGGDVAAFDEGKVRKAFEKTLI
ncbi:MAG: alanine--tRNA ligase [Elusimicrobia bacterium]|nr:alanine--tRNA ligase [Elusimicrobiota bacterium]